MSTIIPKSKTKGVDFCEMKNNFYIIRSDFGCYMQTGNLNKGPDVSIFNLHLSCRDGDHYIGHEDGFFYIIKGDKYRRVKNLTTDSDATKHTLHPNYQGGDHYFSVAHKFYIIFKEKGIFRITKNMNTESDPKEHKLHPSCGKGLYYWGHRRTCYFLKPDMNWGVEYCGSSDLRKNKLSCVRSAHPNVLNFLPGGLSVTKGPAFGVWENIKTITNDSNTPVTWTKKITRMVGYNKEKMTEITHNWKIDASISVSTGELAKLIAMCQFSFSGEYGGSHVNTEKESWEKMTEEEEEIKFDLKLNKRLYLWQYKLGLGEESVLFCRDLKITNDPNPPTEVPLPEAKEKLL